MNLGAITRNAHLWLPQYLNWKRTRSTAWPSRLWVAICDHYEPYWRNTDDTLARARVRLWRERWPRIAARYRDCAGKPARYTFFYPEEEYRPELLDHLAEMTRAGIGDVEIHLHHDGEGQQNFLDRMGGFIETLSSRHGLLRKNRDGRLAFAFIHGNWALDNARPDGRYCGLNNEITLLRDLGCYADFTMPCVPDVSQGGPVNAIYWAIDDPERPRSFENGHPVAPGDAHRGDLLMIPGPLHLNWTNRPIWKPRIETGELASNDRVRPERFILLLESAPRIGGDAFLKLYSHGTQERNSACLLGSGDGDGDLDLLYRGLLEECRRRNVEVHFATAWELYQAVQQALKA